MARRIIEEGTESRFTNPDSFEGIAQEYIRLKNAVAAMEERSKVLRNELFETLDLEGEEDASGSIVLNLPSSVDGVVRLVKQRRSKRTPDLDAIEALANELGVFDKIFEMRPVLNEDALMALYYEDLITEEQLDELFPETITWALMTPKK